MLLCRRCKLRAYVSSYFSDLKKSTLLNERKRYAAVYTQRTNCCRRRRAVNCRSRSIKTQLGLYNHSCRRYLRSTFQDPTQRDPYSCELDRVGATSLPWDTRHASFQVSATQGVRCPLASVPDATTAESVYHLVIYILQQGCIRRGFDPGVRGFDPRKR